jgi:hypothetical protein
MMKPLLSRHKKYSPVMALTKTQSRKKEIDHEENIKRK